MALSSGGVQVKLVDMVEIPFDHRLDAMYLYLVKGMLGPDEPFCRQRNEGPPIFWAALHFLYVWWIRSIHQARQEQDDLREDKE